MTSPFNKLKKIRSWDEIRTRGGQAVSAYGERMGLREQVPTDAEFVRLLDRERLGVEGVSAESLMQEFFLNAERHFFPTFGYDSGYAGKFKELFPQAARELIESAARVVEGLIDFLGYRNVYIGRDVDWHLEAVSLTRSPLKHWKEFDELGTAESGDKKIVWELNRHQHFFTLGVAYSLTDEERFADTFVSHIESWMEQNPPGMGVNWSSSLEVSFRAMSWIWAFQFFRESAAFSPELFQRTLKFLYLHGRHIEKYLSRYYSPNTHLTGEALGLYYLGTQLPFFQRAAHWRKLGEEILSDEIERQVYDDGVYFEQSTWYQRYTVDFYIQFVVLKSLANDGPGGTAADVLEARISAALEFMMYVTRPDGTTPMIGDADGGRALPLTTDPCDDHRGTLDAGADLLGRPDLKYVAARESQESFWLFGPDRRSFRQTDGEEPETTSKHFPAGGYCVMRDGWLDTDNYLLVDCGPLGALSGGHGHADALAIEVSIHGKKLLVDSGTYSYHESPEIRNQFRSTKSHNTLTVDDESSSEPAGTFSWRSRAEAKVNAWVSDIRFDYFAGEHDGYMRLEGEAIHERRILFLKNDYIIIRDEVRVQGEHQHSLNFHFPAGSIADIEGEGRFAAGDDWRMFVFDDGGQWQKSEGSISSNYGSMMTAPFLQFSSTGRGKQEYFTFILPAGPGQEGPEVSEIPIEGARAFAIRYGEYTDVLICNDDRSNIVGTELIDTNFELTWARIGSLVDTPEEFVLIGGNHFGIGGHEVLSEPNELSFATIRQIGKDLNVNTQKGRFLVTLP